METWVVACTSSPAHGVSVWVDSLSREMLETGHLARLIEKDAVVGVTSNPTIFQKALSTGDWYDEQLRAELERSDDTKEVFFALAVEDVKRACDLLHPVWERTKGVDGFVSIEVDPDLAYDREASFEQAKELSELVDRDNVYVKIPATVPGIGAIEDSIAAGRPINITLIFSLERHAEVIEAYLRGLERLVEDWRRPDATSSRSRASSSRASTPRRTGASPRSGGTTSRASSRSRTPSSRISTTSRPSPGSAGRRSPPRARGRSAACGRRPRRRTPPTRTSSTSRSSSGLTP